MRMKHKTWLAALLALTLMLGQGLTVFAEDSVHTIEPFIYEQAGTAENGQYNGVQFQMTGTELGVIAKKYSGDDALQHISLRTEYARYDLPFGIAQYDTIAELLKQKKYAAEDIGYVAAIHDARADEAVLKAAEDAGMGQVLSAVRFDTYVYDRRDNAKILLHGIDGLLIKLSLVIPGGKPSDGWVLYSLDEQTGELEIVDYYQVSEEEGAVVVWGLGYSNTVFILADNTVSYSDVPSEHWADSYIGALSARRDLNGVGGGLFDPGRPVTRAEIIKMIACHPYNYYPEFAQPPSSFSDVPDDAWYTPYVLMLEWDTAMKGLTRDGSGMLYPNRPVTREEAAWLFATLSFTPDPETQPEVALEDVYTDADSIDPYFSEAVETLYRTEMMRGYPDGSFNPQGIITRAEAAKLLWMSIYGY